MSAAFPPLQLHLRSTSGDLERAVSLDQVVIASWTGRDRAAMEDRLSELERLGVRRPPSLPMLYRIAASRVTTAPRIEVFGGKTSGEVEFVLLQLEGRLWVGVGSDHTDRIAEAQDAALSKQLCDKPIALEFWDFADLELHWDQLCLRSFLTTRSGVREIYQDGSVAAMLPPRALLDLLAATDAASGCKLLFCGTLPTRGGIRPAGRFDFELEDPVLCRKISSGYEVQTLPPFLSQQAADLN